MGRKEKVIEKDTRVAVDPKTPRPHPPGWKAQSSYPTNIFERIKHLFGSHCWVIDYFGDGFPMRECQICGLVEVKPLGARYFMKAGKGTTLQSTWELYRKHYDSSPTLRGKKNE